VKGESGASNPTQPRHQACESAGGATQEPHKTQAPLLDLALPPLTETLRPLRGERQDRCEQTAVNRCGEQIEGDRSKVAVRDCPQLASISRPSSSTGTRTTSRIGGGFSSSGGLKPRLARMRLTEVSSPIYAMTFSLPPHWRQASGSAWYTLSMSLVDHHVRAREKGSAPRGAGSDLDFSLTT